MTAAGFPALVLFDLDGTLLDSAPDFVATIDVLRAQRGEGAMPAAALRPHVSRGARAMLAAAFPQLEEAAREALVPPFLAIYREQLARHGAPFDGIQALLAAIEAAGSRWGIVTNKPEALARALLPLLGWESRCAASTSGKAAAAIARAPFETTGRSVSIAIGPYPRSARMRLITARKSGALSSSVPSRSNKASLGKRGVMACARRPGNCRRCDG
jgi:phosphoglycolate phosphatase